MAEARRSLDHITKKHPDIPLDAEAKDRTDTWKVTIHPSETLCKDCEEDFKSWEELDNHYRDEHFPAKGAVGDSKPQLGGESRGGDENDDDNDGGESGAPGPSQNRSRPGGSIEFSGTGTSSQSAPSADASTAHGRKRSERARMEPEDLADAGSRGCGISCETASADAGSSVADHLPPILRNSGDEPETIFSELGSQFKGQSEFLFTADGAADLSLTDDPYVEAADSYGLVHLGQLGKGATGVVDSVWDPKRPREELARKTIRFGQAGSPHVLLAQIRREVKALRMLNHRHIIGLVGWHNMRGSMELLMSPAADCDLMSFLDMSGQARQHTLKPLPRERGILDQVVRWVSCLSSALVYMHSVGVTHGDIKPQNILISGSHVWLSDFGTAEFEVDFSLGICSASRWSTPMYCPPEVRSSKPRGREADIWSLGCVFLEVSTWLAGYSTQALRNFRGSDKSQPYHVNFPANSVLGSIPSIIL